MANNTCFLLCANISTHPWQSNMEVLELNYYRILPNNHCQWASKVSPCTLRFSSNIWPLPHAPEITHITWTPSDPFTFMPGKANTTTILAPQGIGDKKRKNIDGMEILYVTMVYHGKTKRTPCRHQGWHRGKTSVKTRQLLEPASLFLKTSLQTIIFAPEQKTVYDKLSTCTAPDFEHTIQKLLKMWCPV